MQNGITLVEGNQLYDPTGISIDDDTQTIYIADSGNDRIIKWKFDEKQGQIIAGGNGRGNGLNQLDWPTDVILDKKTNSILICDLNNRRVVRWLLEINAYGQIVINDIDCGGLKIDTQGNIYVSDYVNNEIRKWSAEDPEGIIVAGGNGKGNQLNQLNYPIYFFVDKDESIYVSDHLNHRVMKWIKNAKEGIVVAGGQGKGNLLTQLKDSSGVMVDHLNNIYVVDSGNNRIVRWSKDSKKGQVLVGGNEKGEEANQFDYPTGLAMDRQGNLYVADFSNHRIQKFLIDNH
ncbi:unnamed protein product [Adineta steineri]|uniref:NHL repeat containing protein n=1 Tax=Adineta steineri TaxID=433720 RepID=A0A815MSQ5_9BILA|nr:unnamed protein product [Adineta steineri]CAF1480062.1 unnamed protein product [Adineta steineri]CAF1638361.1 unnamed protein product [Adineta steineri]